MEKTIRVNKEKYKQRLLNNAKKKMKYEVADIDDCFVNIKTMLHELEKKEIYVEELYEQLDNIGIQLYIFKEMLESK